MTHYLGIECFLLKGTSAAFGRPLSSSSSALRITVKTAFHGQTQRLGVVIRRSRKRMAGLAKPPNSLSWLRMAVDAQPREARAALGQKRPRSMEMCQSAQRFCSTFARIL